MYNIIYTGDSGFSHTLDDNYYITVMQILNDPYPMEFMHSDDIHGKLLMGGLMSYTSEEPGKNVS